MCSQKDKTSDRLLVLGADWNKVVDDDPNDIGVRTGLKPRGPDSGLRIDGFYVSPAINTAPPGGGGGGKRGA